MRRDPVARDVDAAGDPDALVPGGVVEETLERGGTTWRPVRRQCSPTDIIRGRSTPSRYRTSKLSFRYEKNWSPELKPCAVAKRMSLASSVYGTISCGLPVAGIPVWQVIGIAVGVVEKAALLGDEAARLFGLTPALVPAERPVAGHPRVDLDRLGDVLALDLLGDVLVVDPAITVCRDLPVCREHRRDGRRVALQRHSHTVDRNRHVAPGESACSRQKPARLPYSYSNSIFMLRMPRDWRGADRLRQKCLGSGVAVQDRVFAALFVIDDELQCDAGVAGPPSLGRRSRRSRLCRGDTVAS